MDYTIRVNKRTKKTMCTGSTDIIDNPFHGRPRLQD